MVVVATSHRDSSERATCCERDGRGYGFDFWILRLADQLDRASKRAGNLQRQRVNQRVPKSDAHRYRDGYCYRYSHSDEHRDQHTDCYRNNRRVSELSVHDHLLSCRHSASDLQWRHGARQRLCIRRDCLHAELDLRGQQQRELSSSLQRDELA